MATCTDLQSGLKGPIEPGCGASYRGRQLHATCCHRTFAAVSGSDIHDRLRERLDRCPTDAELGSGKSPLHQDPKGIWRREGRPPQAP